MVQKNKRPGPENTEQYAVRPDPLTINSRPENLALDIPVAPKQGSEQEDHPGEQEIQGVYIISVAARLLEMHPQTLRKYERLGLVRPSRTMGMLRLYSEEDLQKLRLIRHMQNNLGMNLAGVEFALTFLNRIMDLRERIQAMSQAEALNRFVVLELEEMLKELGGIFPDKPQRV